MLSTRVKAALIFVPLLIFLAYLGGWVYNLFIIAILMIAAFEFGRLFTTMGYSPSLAMIIGGVLILTLQRWLPLQGFDGVLTTVVFLLTALVGIFQYEKGSQDAAFHFAIHLAGIFYIGWVGGFLISIRALPDGRGWLLTVLPIIWLADAGAYFIGRWLGKHKLAPKVSPGKTWEGIIGGILTGTLSGFLLIMLWRAVGFLPDQTPLWQGLVLGAAIATLAPIGDLLVSLLKRTAGVKDTGRLLAGHGGILDRIDSWIWAALIGCLLIPLFL